MKYLYLTAICILTLSLSSHAQSDDAQWSEAMRVKQVSNNQNPDLWDMPRMKGDIEEISDFMPIRKGAFPVAHYDSLLSYRGGGSIASHFAPSMPEYRLQVEDKEVMFCSLHIGDSPFYKKEDRNRAFFTIITVVDTLDENNFAPGASYFLSRNHPDYGGEGSFMTKNDKIDFVAFTTPDKGDFAIVNIVTTDTFTLP